MIKRLLLSLLLVFVASSAFADNQPKRLPYAVSLGGIAQPGDTADFTPFTTIPEGKIFVIETFSASVSMPEGQKPYSFTLEFSSGQLPGTNFFIIPVFLTNYSSQGFSCSDNQGNSWPESDIFTNAQNIRIYVTGQFRAVLNRDFNERNNGCMGFSVHLYGYLINENSNTLSP